MKEWNIKTNSAVPWHRVTVSVTYGAVVLVVVAAPFAYYFSTQAVPRSHRRAVAGKPGSAAVVARPAPEGVAHLSTPKFVKGIYVTSLFAGLKTRFDHLVELVDRTELNAMVIDIKNGTGQIAFAPTSDALQPFAEVRPSLGDLKDFTAPLKEKGIYLIARLFVFQDPALVAKRPDLAVQRADGGVWSDRKGVTWIDAAAKDAWKYNVMIAREAYAGGFDEVQLDYVRFPTDGTLGAMQFPAYDGKRPKAEVMKEFFLYMDHELRVKSRIPISVDLFGLTMIRHDFDLGIGQKLGDAALHFDHVSPMVYPSHYPAGFEGLANPADFPYQIVHDTMTKGESFLGTLRLAHDARVSRIRPWIQDFDLGATYDAFKVREQMRAAVDGGASGWLLWNARNVYTEEALGKE